MTMVPLYITWRPEAMWVRCKNMGAQICWQDDQEWASNYEGIEENQSLFGLVCMAFGEVQAFAS